MRVVIEFSMDSSGFEDSPIGSVHHILNQAAKKIFEQLERPDALCTAPEAADKLLDINGNTVGTVQVLREEAMEKYGVEQDDKEKTGADGKPATKCPLCGSDLDSGGACPKHGTEPFEKRPEPKKDQP